MFYIHIQLQLYIYIFLIAIRNEAEALPLITENKFSSIGPIYYEYGSMVITYEDSNKAVRALYCLRESCYEDKHLLGKYGLVFRLFEKTQETTSGMSATYSE